MLPVIGGPVPSVTPVAPPRSDYWNLDFCSGGNAVLQVDDVNLNSGTVIKDTNTGICYVLVNQGLLVAPLVVNYYETDCQTC